MKNNIKTDYDIIFTEKFDAILCLDGNIPSKEFFIDFINIPIIAADGSSIRLMDMSIMPDYIVGDLDTLSKSHYINEIDKNIIHYFPDQETNDFEKSLNYAISCNFYNILIIGFDGGELEHTLNNWSVFKKFSGKLNLCLYTDKRYAIPVSKSVSLETKIDEIISIIPQPTAILSTKNLKWELNKEELSLGIREGARNIALANKIYIQILSGDILLFFDSRIPYTPLRISNP